MPTNYTRNNDNRIFIAQVNKKQMIFAFETQLEVKSWKAAIEDAKTLYIQTRNGGKSPIANEIAVIACSLLY